MKKRNEEHKHLATVVYDRALRKQIEEEVESKYSKRIEHLVNVNNELMNELEQGEKENSGRGISIEAYNEESRSSGTR